MKELPFVTSKSNAIGILLMGHLHHKLGEALEHSRIHIAAIALVHELRNIRGFPMPEFTRSGSGYKEIEGAIRKMVHAGLLEQVPNRREFAPAGGFDSFVNLCINTFFSDAKELDAVMSAMPTALLSYTKGKVTHSRNGQLRFAERR